MKRTPAGTTFNALIYIVVGVTFFMVLLNNDTLTNKYVPLGALALFLLIYPFTLSRVFK